MFVSKQVGIEVVTWSRCAVDHITVAGDIPVTSLGRGHVFDLAPRCGTLVMSDKNF